MPHTVGRLGFEQDICGVFPLHRAVVRMPFVPAAVLCVVRLRVGCRKRRPSVLSLALRGSETVSLDGNDMFTLLFAGTDRVSGWSAGLLFRIYHDY